MRVAIVHYWLLGMRGGEKVVEALCRMLPEADLFTLFYDAERVSPVIRARTVKTSFLNPARRHYRSLLPLMPMALESFDLRGYDLIVSSESGPAKGVLAPSTARHVCYTHTPMRYLWDLYPAYLNEFTSSPLRRAAMAPIANYLRIWDYASAARVDEFVANSENVRRRIRRAYGRDAQVIYPPVPVDSYRCSPSEDYFLIVSELVAYKQLDYAVRLFARTGMPLKIVGGGPDFRTLKQLARRNVEFCGRVSDTVLVDLYARCRALVMPGEEDFGLTMVEALASGKPMIALGRGGAREIVGPGCGVLYGEPTEAALEAALEQFESAVFDQNVMQTFASRFSEAEFRRKMHPVLYGTSSQTA
jgi:glycosyltransferase involved in cell wall biosynthesis